MPFAFIGKNDLVIQRIPSWVTANQSIVNRAAKRVDDFETFGPTVTILDSDSFFVDVDDKFLERVVAWTKGFAKKIGIKYVKNGFDCEKFSKAFSLAMDIAIMHANVEAQALVYRISTRQVKEWAGVKAGGHHSLLAVKTRSSGYVIIEPQNGTMCKLADYPNREYIYELLTGK